MTMSLVCDFGHINRNDVYQIKELEYENSR